MGRERRGAAPTVARGRVEDAVDRAPAAAKLVVFALPFAIFPLFTDSEYLTQVGIDTLIYVLLALGLNVAVGWVGLLDLGFVAFFGLGAYLYAALASEYAGRHWEAQFLVPLIAVAVAATGFLVGLPSRRLVGDYLAIVTLFFLQIWLVVLVNASFTRGPNGISDIYPLKVFGREIVSLEGYYYVTFAAFVLIVSFLYLLDRSRTGRAWRALREDELAAELMTMPVNRLKLMAFAVGAGIAGIAGALYAPQQGAVFPGSFDIVLLITVYAMVVLGGAGSIVGVTIGAVLINASLEALRDPDDASWLFYAAVVLGLILLMRPRWLPVAVLAGTAVFGLVVHEFAEQVRPSLVAGSTFGTARVDELRRLVGPPTGGGDRTGRAPSRPARAPRVHRPHRGDPRAHARPQPALARGRARPGAVPRRVRVGERPRRPARGCALRPHRRDARRADGNAPAGASRQAHGWRSSDDGHGARATARGAWPVAVVRRSPRALQPRPDGRRARDRQRHRAERGGEDDVLQRRHRRLSRPTRARSCSRARASSGSTHTRSRAAASPARSRRSACS